MTNEVAKMNLTDQWEFRAYSKEEVLNYLTWCSHVLKETDKDSLWFRGQSNEKYFLRPTIIRDFAEKKAKKFNTYCSFQRHQYEEFKHQIDAAPELPYNAWFTTADYIALMQHYTVSTNLLDWTESVFPSLYFALQHYFENKTERQHDAVIYLFHPEKYNRYRRKRLDDIRNNIHYPKYNWIMNSPLQNILANRINYLNIIPNLSVETNQDYFREFVLGDLEFDRLYTENPAFQEFILELKDTAIFLPLAIKVSYLNPRIRAQSGCFVAYNLYTSPTFNDNDFLTAFEHVQQQALQSNLPEHFLYKIVMDKRSNCCSELRDWLCYMGIDRNTVYPDLGELYRRL